MKYFKSFSMAVTTLFSAALIFGAEPGVNAKVSAQEMTLNSSITLLLEITGIKEVGSAPNLNIPDFEIQPAGQMSSFQWVNGQTTSLITFNYVLTPMKTGNLQIPSITLSVNGKSYSTQPIIISVHADSNAGNAASGAAAREPAQHQVQVPAEGLKPLFMTATVDSDKVYVGQQVLLKVQFLKRPEVRFASQARYSEPDLTGFLVEKFPQQEYSTTINGARYDVTELPYALFPTSDGDFAIGSARIEMAVRSEPDPFDPNSFFQSFFGRTNVAQLSTRAIPVHVRALPANKPAAFSGAVGRFKMNAKVDTDKLEVGKPFNLIVTVEGVGNIKTIKEPLLPELHGFRRYETISASKVSNEGKFLHGSKEFKILLIPQVSGQLTIPSAAFIYFNPAKGEYVTETTPEIPLQIKPGNLNQADQETRPQSSAAGQNAEGVRVMEKDIRFIKPGKVRPVSSPIYLRTPFLLFSFLPPLFAFVAFLSRRHTQLRTERAAEFRSKGALKTARKNLARARKEMITHDPTVFYGAIHAAVAGYLADKFSTSASGMVWEDVEKRLATAGADESLRNDIRDVFDQADMARFATSSFTDEARENALTKADSVLERLNEVFA